MASDVQFIAPLSTKILSQILFDLIILKPITMIYMISMRVP